jgi:hypothetical protein
MILADAFVVVGLGAEAIVLRYNFLFCSWGFVCFSVCAVGSDEPDREVWVGVVLYAWALYFAIFVTSLGACLEHPQWGLPDHHPCRSL